MFHSWFSVSILALVVGLVVGGGGGGGEAEDFKLKGPNVCVDQREERKTVNITYLQSQDVKEYTWCLKVPPRCAKWTTKMITRYKPKNITRVVNHARCCKGYAPDDDNFCQAQCLERPCLHGACVEPDVCSCNPGFSGPTCNEVGCPGGNWGPDCSEECLCENGARCEPHTGQCLCPPGFTGARCQRKCDSSHFGLDCANKCDCEAGNQCHHVTGDCNPCSQGTYGKMCALTCACSGNGTALCYHENGNCFCKPNFYGRTCEMFCPFGYLDGVCHTEPMAVGFCSCPSDLYRCDETEGCVCKDGFDCEGGTQFIDFASLQAAAASGQDSGSHAQAVSIVVTVLVFALVITVLVVAYYRRRMRRMQEDLKNRSVLYIENTVLSPNSGLGQGSGGGRHDLVITNPDSSSGQAPHNSMMAPNMLNSNRIQNNAISVTNNLSRSPNPGLGAGVGGAHGGGAVEKNKNVNIDRFKLGEDDAGIEGESPPSGACASSSSGLPPPSSGSCSSDAAAAASAKAKAIEGDSEEEANDNGVLDTSDDRDKLKKQRFDINLYEDFSPSKEKDNQKLADLYRKIAKSNVDAEIINNSTGGAGAAAAAANASVDGASANAGAAAQGEGSEDEEDWKIYVHK